MTDNSIPLHTPQWAYDGTAWHLIVGNQSVAKLIPVVHAKYRWLSVIDGKRFADHGWHAVDFETLSMAQHDIEQWWLCLCQGETYRP